jgi:Trk K+ transport system NAD-binding subunit
VRFSEKAYGKRVEELQVPGNMLISLVMHNGEPETIPERNTTVIREGDLAVISVKDSYIKKAAKWFSDLSEGGL